MKRTEMVRVGADQLKKAEMAIETAMVEVADLASVLGRMRMDSNLSITVGTGAMTHIVETMQALGAARQTIVNAHDQLDVVKTQMGCRTVASGTLGDKTPAQATLTVVGDERAAS
jgi:hypothetical protein